jgi:hypothetical protein
MSFEVTLLDDTVEWVDDADSYQHEGPMTTFFASAAPPEPGAWTRHTSLDSWSVKVASFRTDRVLKIRRVDRARRVNVA